MINGPLNQTSGQLRSLLPFAPTSFKAILQALSANLTKRTVAILAAIGQLDEPASGALALARLDQVQPLYSSTKQYVCCEVPGVAAQLWIVITVLGWLGMGLAVVGMLVLWQLDDTQEAGACCSCACLRPSSLPPAGKLVDAESSSTALHSRSYPSQDQQAWLQRQREQPDSDPVVEVRVTAGGGGRSWLELSAGGLRPGLQTPPQPQEMPTGSWVATAPSATPV
jgi:hypothetical protein